MATDSKPSRSVLALATLASGILFFFSVGLNGIGALPWLAPVPVLAASLSASKRAAGLASFIAYALCGLSVFSFMLRVAPPVAAVAIVLLPAVFFALAILAARRAAARLDPALAVFAFPAVWTAYEYLSFAGSPHGTAGSLAYTQMGFLPLIQVASLTGITGITFILMLVPSGLALAWHFRKDRRSMMRALAGPLAVFLLAMAWGGFRLAQPAVGDPLRVGLTSTDSTIEQAFLTDKPAEALPVVRDYARRAAELARRGASIAVLPEKFVGVVPGDEAEIDRVLGDAAKAGHITLVAGLNRIGRPDAHNAAVVFPPDGGPPREYDKIHMLPGFEDIYRIGAGPLHLSVGNAHAGIAICKDMDFPALTRVYGRAGTGILFVPAWDFVRDAHLHSRMAVLRGVENGFAIVRTAQQGLLTVSDDRGRILAEAVSPVTGETFLVADVHPGAGHTLYSRAGDWFAWVVLAGLALLLFGSAYGKATSGRIE